MGEDWHRRIASLLSIPFDQGWDNQVMQLRALELIPLVDGSWVAAKEGNIFYSHVNNILLPKEMGLRLVSPANNASRRTLLDHLGVRSASVVDVRNRILQRYTRGYAPEAPRISLSVNFSVSLDHLRFLYLNHDSDSMSDSGIKDILRIYNHRDILAPLTMRDLYIQDDQPYGAQQLLGPDGARTVGVAFVR
jgi:hypothetical protein